MSISRADRGSFANWWFTVDKVALIVMAGLIGIGLMLAVAASPAITGGPMSAGDFRYAARQLIYAMVALSILAGASLLSLRQIKIARDECYCPVDVTVLPGIGHAPHREAPNRTLIAMSDFVNRILHLHGEGELAA